MAELMGRILSGIVVIMAKEEARGDSTCSIIYRKCCFLNVYCLDVTPTVFIGRSRGSSSIGTQNRQFSQSLPLFSHG